MIRLNYFALLLCSLATAEAWSQAPSRITEEERELVTYPYTDPSPVAINPKTAKIYPYTLFEGYSKTGKKQKWKVVKLENDYIEVYVLPEIGGKIWGAIEKSTGKEFIYRNEVIKFRNIAMRGPWTSGGVEFNFGIIGHHPSTSSPVDFKTITNKDGSVSCVVGNLDLPSRTNWRVEIRLPKDKAYIETHASWNNPTPIHQSYYNWMTAAAVVSDDLEFYYPGNLALEHDGSPAPWPIDAAGRDVSKYKNNAFGAHKSIHTVGEYNNFMGGYYRESHFGFGHSALYDEMPGHKLWLWALSRSGGIWEDLLTDNDGQYMEFQAGRLFNQYSPSASVKSVITQVPFSPGVTDRWSERWFPVKDIGGITKVSSYGVLNVRQENGNLRIGVNALGFAEATIEVVSNKKSIYREKKTFRPMDVFEANVPIEANATYEVIVKEMDLYYTTARKENLQRPFITTTPAKSVAVDALYNEGVQYKEYREYSNALKTFREILSRDSIHFGALTDLAELHYRSAKYDSALYSIYKVLRHDTYHPKANYLAGISYKAKGDLVNAMESFGWAARSMEYRSAAYAQMAAICLQKGNYMLTGHYGLQSLDYNRYNFNALHALAVNYRKTGDTAAAIKVLDEIDQYDALDHFAHYERSLLTQSTEDFKTFASLIRNEFPYQTYLEMALGYLSLGQREDAVALLMKAPKHSMVKIWIAYIVNDKQLLSDVASESPAFVFPYRTESLAPLEWAVSQNDNWRFKYFLGLNYYALQREEEAIAMFKACGDRPEYAPFYLTRSRLVKDKPSVEKDLLAANKISPNEWRTWSFLTGYYEKNRDYAQELIFARKASEKFKDDYTLGFDYAKALLNNKRYKESVQLLRSLVILPFEGSGEGQAVYEQATLFRALELIKNKNYKEALKEIDASRQWPENLGEGKPYDVDTRMQDYLTAYCLRKLGKTKEAGEFDKSGSLQQEIKSSAPKGDKYAEILDTIVKLPPL